jgi:deoxycytidylate deaminase
MIAAAEAKKSPMSQKHGCVVIHKNKVVTTGYNKQVEPFSLTSIHAEVNALMKAKKILNRSELKQAKLMVVRIGTNSMDNPLKYSKPCKVCQSFIDKFGIQLVYYSTSGA